MAAWAPLPPGPWEPCPARSVAVSPSRDDTWDFCSSFLYFCRPTEQRQAAQARQAPTQVCAPQVWEAPTALPEGLGQQTQTQTQQNGWEGQQIQRQTPVPHGWGLAGAPPGGPGGQTRTRRRGRRPHGPAHGQRRRPQRVASVLLGPGVPRTLSCPTNHAWTDSPRRRGRRESPAAGRVAPRGSQAGRRRRPQGQGPQPQRPVPPRPWPP